MLGNDPHALGRKPHDMSPNPEPRAGCCPGRVADRYLLARRWPTEFALGLFYVHLSNRVPPHSGPDPLGIPRRQHACSLMRSRLR